MEVICVKGSGWDLETIEAKGLPSIRLEPLLELRKLKNYLMKIWLIYKEQIY